MSWYEWLTGRRLIRDLCNSTVTYCFRCGTEVPEGASVCPDCNARIDY